MSLDVSEACATVARELAIQAAGPSNESTVSMTSNSTSHSVASTLSSSQSPPDSMDCVAASSPSPDIHNEELDASTEPKPGVRRFLLFCASSGEFHTSLDNIDLTGVSDDAVLWAKTRESYRKILRRRTQTWSGRVQVLFSKPQYFKFLKVNVSIPSRQR